MVTADDDDDDDDDDDYNSPVHMHANTSANQCS
jgi:hypothetical protein